MQRRDRESSHSSSHRRPRLMRASTTDPTPITVSLVNHASLGASHSDSTAMSSAMASGRASPHGYRRATDLLNHVAYRSSCASPGGGSNGRSSSSYRSDAASGESSKRRPGLLHTMTSSAVVGGHASRNAAVAVHAHRSNSQGPGTSCLRRSSVESEDDVFGSSPASTNTNSSLDDSLHSQNYYSFPSFDTWDPNSQDREEDDDDGKVP